jgi:hypothetical protein
MSAAFVFVRQQMTNRYIRGGYMGKAGQVRALFAAALTLALPSIVPAQNLQVGYAVVTHETPTTEGLSVFETFGLNRGAETTQAGVLSSPMSTRGVIFGSANRALGRDLGLAIANPNPNPQGATVTLTLQRNDGVVISTKEVRLGVREQTAQFISQLFADRPEIENFTGSILFESSVPVAVVGLRFRGTNFSTLPFTNLSPATPVPPLPAGAGGAGAFILPQFAVGEGWASEIVIVNHGDSAHDIQVDLFGQNGQPLVATLNGQTQSSFTGIVVPAHGVAVLSVRDASGNSPF